jgi:hypothetical protein
MNGQSFHWGFECVVNFTLHYAVTIQYLHRTNTNTNRALQHSSTSTYIRHSTEIMGNMLYCVLGLGSTYTYSILTSHFAFCAHARTSHKALSELLSPLAQALYCIWTPLGAWRLVTLNEKIHRMGVQSGLETTPKGPKGSKTPQARFLRVGSSVSATYTYAYLGPVPGTYMGVRTVRPSMAYLYLYIY